MSQVGRQPRQQGAHVLAGPIPADQGVAVAIATDLLAWTRLLTLDGDLAKAEPGTLRYRVLHVGARIVRGQRRRHLSIPTTWLWADQLASAFTRVLAIPAPT